MAEFVAQYFVEFLCGIVVVILSYFMKRILVKIKRFELVENGMQSLLKDRIIAIYNKCADRGYCPIYERENAEKMYKEYHALGGNGTITELMNKVMSMPTEKASESKRGGEQTYETN